MKRLLAALIGACLLPAQGLALSCMRPDVARSFTQADAAEEVYIVVHGVLRFDESRLPETDWNDQAATPQHTLISASLTGEALSARGFTVGFDQTITLDAQCFGPWCASARSGEPVLVFLKRTAAGGYLAALDPCYSLVFSNPTSAQLNLAERCMKGEVCEPAH